MGVSILLTEQILAMFLVVGVGYALVKTGLLKSEESKVISNIVVYVCMPCVTVDAFQIEMTKDKVQGLLLAVVVAAVVHAVMIGLVKLLGRPLGFNSIEKASMIYSNSGNLVIPLVASVLGKEWVFYTSAYTLVQTMLVWTHGVSVISGESQKDIRKIVTNPNIIALFLGFFLFVSGIQLPVIVGSCVSSLGDMIGPVSMLVIGMLIGNVNLLWVFRQKRIYLICLIRLVVVPVAAAAAMAVIKHLGIHRDAGNILLVVLLATAAPAAAMVTQLAQLYGKDAKYASVINVMSVIFCIVTMPLMVLLYEVL